MNPCGFCRPLNNAQERVSLVKNKWLVSALLLVFIILTSTGLAAAVTEEELLEEAKEVLDNHYVDNVPAEVMEAESMEEMLYLLDDPYTNYFTDEEFQNIEESIDRDYSGIGVSVEMVDEGAEVITVLEDSPAEEEGIQPGDILLEADGQQLAGLSIEEVTALVRGEEGTEVELKVDRNGEIMFFQVERQEITAEQLEGELRNGVTGYLHLKTFGSDTPQLFSDMLEDLAARGAERWMFDLRYNRGGRLMEALEIAGHFIGDKIAIQMKSVHEEKEMPAFPSEPSVEPPAILLTNRESASAAEVLAAAVKDHGKGILVGSATFGKGTVQSWQELSAGVLYFTSHRFYSPHGNSIDGEGVEPHVAVEEADPEVMGDLLLKSYHRGKEDGSFLKLRIDDHLFRLNTHKEDDPLYGTAYGELKNIFEDDLLSAERIMGLNRYKTAVEISQKGWENSGTVVLARGDEFPDALAGAPLAYSLDAPILLSAPAQLSGETRQEIERLGASKAVMLGGEEALSQEVEDELLQMGMNLERIDGEDRYDTAGLIAQSIDPPEQEMAVVASGVNFPDALAVAPYAAEHGHPILLTDKDRLPSPTEGALEGVDSTLVIGGENAVSAQVMEELPEPERISGEDRYSTALEIFRELEFAGESTFFAPGTVFPDALSGAVLAARESSPVLLTGEEDFPLDVRELIAERRAGIFYLLGGRIPPLYHP